MYYWRVTKYNPIYRDAQGRYTREEWTSIEDIGKLYKGEELTVEEYEVIENAYVEAVVFAMKQLELETLKVTELETGEYTVYKGVSDLTSEHFYKTVQNNKDVSIDDVPHLVKLILREIIWAKLVSDDLCVHFGYDYYMYFIIKKKLEKVIRHISEKGLFIEDFKSPYL